MQERAQGQACGTTTARSGSSLALTGQGQKEGWLAKKGQPTKVMCAGKHITLAAKTLEVPPLRHRAPHTGGRPRGSIYA